MKIRPHVALAAFALSALFLLPAPGFAAEPLAAGAAPAAASAATLSESIRERVDSLRYQPQQDLRGARIVLDEFVAKFYESRHFAPAWQEIKRLDQLIASIDDLRYDGLDPGDYHLEALQSYRLDLRMNSPLTPQDRADLELLATDAFMLGLYHVYLGKVDPLKLNSQWNFSQRPTPTIDEGMRRFAARLDAGEIREAFDSARPAHVWYQRGRDNLRAYRAIEAAGGWPTIAAGPTLKPDMSDARVPLLRKRLAISRDLAADSPSPADDTLYDAALEQHYFTNTGIPVLAAPLGRTVRVERGQWALREEAVAGLLTPPERWSP